MNWIELLIELTLVGNDAGALASTARDALDEETAAVHVAAARVAGRRYDVNPELLLSIAWHESRYRHTERTPEAGGKVSCGVMTPVPTYSAAACGTATPSVLDGYLAGAEHLRYWLDAPRCHGNMWCALSGYAGGGRFIVNCARNPGAYPRECSVPWVFMDRARLIRRRMAASS